MAKSSCTAYLFLPIISDPKNRDDYRGESQKCYDNATSTVIWRRCVIHACQ